MKIKKFLAGLTFAVVCGLGGYGAVRIFASEVTTDSEVTTEPNPIITTIATTEEEKTREKITFEYYTITEEAAKMGWTCHTIDRCDKNKIMVYIYDPALIGQHKFNIVTYFNFVEADLTFVFVDKYNNILEERTTTYKAGDSYRGIAIVIDDYPPGTKYVKFKDMTNIVYFYPSKKDS